MADPRRSWRPLLSPHRDVRHDRNVSPTISHAVCPALTSPFPDQSLRHALRRDRCFLPDQDRSRRQRACSTLRTMASTPPASSFTAPSIWRDAMSTASRIRTPRPGMAVSAMECGLLPLAQTSMSASCRRYHGLRRDRRRCRRARAAGQGTSAITRRGPCGTTDCSWSGRTIPATFNLLYRMERACEVQVMALSCNTKSAHPPQESGNLRQGEAAPNLPNRSELAGRRCCANLDRADPSYRD